MSTVKVRPAKDVQKYLDYLTKKNGEDREHVLVSAIGSNLNSFTNDIEINHNWHHSKGNKALTIVQSWNAKESKNHSPQHFNEISKKLVSRIAPGHNAIIVTHSDTDNTHSHIVLDPVQVISGKRIQNKLNFQDKVREINDALMKELGLEVCQKRETKRLSSAAIQINKRGISWTEDLRQKAEFAQKYARSFEEHEKILANFGIQIKRITEKNITYIHPKSNRFKRGRKLSENLEINVMKEKFKSNYLKYLSDNPMELYKKDHEFFRLKSITEQQLGTSVTTSMDDYLSRSFKEFQIFKKEGKAFSLDLKTQNQSLLIRDDGAKFVIPTDELASFMYENSTSFLENKKDPSKILLRTYKGHKYFTDRSTYEAYASKKWIELKSGEFEGSFSLDAKNTKHVNVKTNDGLHFLIPKDVYREAHFNQELKIFQSKKSKNHMMAVSNAHAYYVHRKVLEDWIKERVKKTNLVKGKGVIAILGNGSVWEVSKSSSVYKVIERGHYRNPKNLTMLFLRLEKGHHSEPLSRPKNEHYEKIFKEMESNKQHEIFARQEDYNLLSNIFKKKKIAIKIKPLTQKFKMLGEYQSILK